MDDERTLWKNAMDDYKHAYDIASAVWPKETPPEVIQAATATLLIHRKELGRRAGYAPTSSAPAPAASDIPACPKCGGAMKDQRQSKSSPKAPDFKCLQEKGACGQQKVKDGKTYFNETALWADR